MSAGVRNALVVGGGISGMAAAISLQDRGVAVDLIEVDPEWRVVGAGITITGPTLRAFRGLNILEAVREKGFFSTEVKFFEADGAFIRAMESPVLEAGIPASGGILRPDLHRILSDRTLQGGADVRLGVKLQQFTQDDSGVVATTSDGKERRYDVLVGADGSSSELRQQLFADGPSLSFVGQGCWRMLAARPDTVTGPEIYFGENNIKVGLNPCSPQHMYIFATIAMPGNPRILDEELPDRMREILGQFGGHMGMARDSIGPDSSINYRPLHAMLKQPPWHVGRVGLIGDAVHATTPHLASGAGLAIEDGLILGEMLGAIPDVEDTWTRFEARRWDRARLVVENSLKIARIEQEGGGDEDIQRLMGESSFALAQPY